MKSAGSSIPGVCSAAALMLSLLALLRILVRGLPTNDEGVGWAITLINFPSCALSLNILLKAISYLKDHGLFPSRAVWFIVGYSVVTLIGCAQYYLAGCLAAWLYCREWFALLARSVMVLVGVFIALVAMLIYRYPDSGFLTGLEGVLSMRIAQVAPLTEAIPPKLYGGTERVV